MNCYFDNAATTPTDPRVIKAMKPYFFDSFGNSSSIHAVGRKAQQVIDRSRINIASYLNCKPLEIIFTSGATESNNLAFLGIVRPGDHIITSKIEHPSVLKVCQHLAKQGIDVTYIAPNKYGEISSAEVVSSIKKNTRIISIMYVNNEIGVIQPIVKIGNLLRVVNQDRKKNNLPQIFFHSDAVQAAYYLSLDVENLGVDLMSLSGHKIYGPKGVGVLFRKINVDLKPILFGGSQESKIRPGTLNTPAIVGLSRAIDIIKSKQHQKDLAVIKQLSESFIKKMKLEMKVLFIGTPENRIDGILACNFPGIDNKALSIALDLSGIRIGTGSACAAGSTELSHVLQAIGGKMLAQNTIRISFGKYNKSAEISYAIKKFKLAILQLQK